MNLRRRRRSVLLTFLGVCLVGATALAAFWFAPWKLWVDERVDDALPAVALADVEQSPVSDAPTATSTPATTRLAPTSPATAPPAPTSPATAPPAPTSPATAPAARRPSPTSPPTADRDVLLARGSLISHEHRTSGTVSVVRRADGSRVLAISNLDTSNGPDVEVWLSAAPVLSGERGWYVFDDTRHVSLGDLKGNQGNQLYAIPAGLDLADYPSVSLWCARFDVSFGAAELVPAR